MAKKYRYLIGIIFFLAVCVGTGFAAPVKDAHTRVELITEVSGIQPGRPFWVGLHMKMDDKWQVYWKNPGDSGLATVIQWELPEGFNAGDIQWPFPIRMDYPEVTSYGYEGETILLCELKPPAGLPDGSVQKIKAHVTWLACGNICVPGKADLSLSLTVGLQEPSVNEPVREMFKKTMMDWPLTQSDWVVKAYHEGEYFLLHLMAPQRRFSVPKQIEFFPDANDVIDHKASQSFRKVADGYDLVVSKSSAAKGDISQLKGVLFLDSDEGWQEGRRALAVDTAVLDKSTEEEALEKAAPSALNRVRASSFPSNGNVEK
ncbi:MAG: hypothetical protein JW847_01400 [Candidatus Omnitrophica bacterium]|nr:hypothetical protein [Candidatus Omnitrophota bacterium]